MTEETPPAAAPAPRRRARRRGRRARVVSWGSRFLESFPPAKAATLLLGLLSAVGAVWNRADLSQESSKREAVVDTLRRGSGLARAERQAFRFELEDLRRRVGDLEGDRDRIARLEKAERRRRGSGSAADSLFGPPAPAGLELEIEKPPGPIRRLFGWISKPFS